MATFYINGVSRALRSVQRVDLNYSIAAAVRTGDSQRRRTVTGSGFAGVSLVGPPPESESPLRAGRGGLSPRIRWFDHPWFDHVPGCVLEGLSQRHASPRGLLADAPTNKRLVGGSRP